MWLQYRYATHIFDGLDDWPTHLHYLNNTGATGWQGEIGQLDIYRDMRSRGEPSPLLRIAERWLRAELAGPAAVVEAASGAAAHAEADPLQLPSARGGGFSAGRMAAYLGVGHV